MFNFGSCLIIGGNFQQSRGYINYMASRVIINQPKSIQALGTAIMMLVIGTHYIRPNKVSSITIMATIRYTNWSDFVKPWINYTTIISQLATLIS